jgi:hypothetical protein
MKTTDCGAAVTNCAPSRIGGSADVAIVVVAAIFMMPKAADAIV